jgi:hypothetical protein
LAQVRYFGYRKHSHKLAVLRTLSGVFMTFTLPSSGVVEITVRYTDPYDTTRDSTWITLHTPAGPDGRRSPHDGQAPVRLALRLILAGLLVVLCVIGVPGATASNATATAGSRPTHTPSGVDLCAGEKVDPSGAHGPRSAARLSLFMQRYRARWKARTECGAGYVVDDCSGGSSVG